jgi:hypothetical protein
MKESRILKATLYSIAVAVLLVAGGIWIFLTFYFENTLNRVVIPKMEQATLRATQGRFALTLDNISYAHGSFVCNTFVLSRVAYNGSEHGIVLGKLTLDSARFEGISWWDVLCGNDLHLTSLQLDAPRLHMINADSDNALPRNRGRASERSISTAAPIFLDRILLRHADIFLPTPPGRSIEPSYRGISIELRDFALRPAHKTSDPLLFSKEIVFDLPSGHYDVDDSMYSVDVHGIHGSVSDSLITIDSLSYRSNYTEQAFASLHKYFQHRIEYRCTGIQIQGIDLATIMAGGAINVRTCAVATWSVDYYGDLRVPHDPHPVNAELPHTLVAAIKARVTIDSIILNDGTIRHRERVAGSTHASSLVFTHAQVRAHAFSTDSASPLFLQPLHIAVRALFLNEGQIIGTIVYPLHQKAFDLRVDATVGPFNAMLLNSYLISNERKEITAGACLASSLRLDVHDGVATTTVRPQYRGISMRVLPDDVKASRSFFDGIKSFIANTFVLRTTNVDDGSTKAKIGTTTYVRTKKQEFFEFIWLSLRRSLQAVVGF